MAQTSTNITRFKAMLPDGVQLVAVSKFQPLEKLKDAYSVGQRHFGESRADELAAKAAEMPSDTVWHFIGHLQTNKARRVVAHASIIESVDSERLLRLISSEAMRINRTIDVLLQVHVAAEETKTGFSATELLECANNCKSLPGINICGVMGMATNTDNIDRINSDFAAIVSVSHELRTIIPSASVISMGMSDDWQLAVSHGANSVRIGSAIFGSR